MSNTSLDINSAWASLEPGVERILNHWEDGIDPASYMQWYTMTYNYCTNTKSETKEITSNKGNTCLIVGANLIGAELYHHLKTYLEKHLEETTLEAQKDALLMYYTKHWARFTTSATTLNHVFSYLNRHWIRREIDEGHKNVYEIYILGLVSWRDKLFAALEKDVVKACLDLIQKQRDGEVIETFLIKNVVDSFVSLGMDENDSKKSTLEVYVKYFEQVFLEATKQYYISESHRFTSSHHVTDYMKKAEARLAEEETRIQMYLHPSTQKALITTCETALIQDHLLLIQNEFLPLLQADRLEDLARMYGLLVRTADGLERLKNEFEEHVKKQGFLAVDRVAEGEVQGEDEDEDDKKKGKKGDVDPKLYVEALLSVHTKYSALVNTCFRNEAGFAASLDKACREFTNRNSICKSSSSKSPELLAKYCDSVLRKTSKATEDGEIDDVLNKVMTAFKYVEDKDVFQKFYSKNLAKRLVNATSVSDDAEASMITKLREACGFEYTNKLQRMFTDMGVSKDLNDTFKQSNQLHNDTVDFNILVLGTASWPLTLPSSGFNLPEDLEKTYERFQRFYQNKHSGRKLNWLFQLSKGEVKVNYLKGKFIFQVSTYQMGILLQYNNNTTYSWEELLSISGMSPEALTGQLGILVKAKVLLLEPSDASVGSANSKYVLNMDFKSKKVRINLNLPVRSEAKQESDETHRIIEEDRKILIQAAIVRIMKTRKAMKHNALIQEVIVQVNSRFKPTIPDIKKSIDILLEKEYIERKTDEKDMYQYLA